MRNQKKTKRYGRQFLSGLLCIMMVLSVCSSNLCLASAVDDAEDVAATPEQSVSEEPTADEQETVADEPEAAEPEDTPEQSEETADETEQEKGSDEAEKAEEDQTPVQQRLTAHTEETDAADQASVSVEGVLPPGATVTIQAVTKQSDQYEDVSAALDDADYVSEEALAYDISIWDAEGNEIEPDSTVSVKLTLGANLLDDGMAEEALTIVHLKEDQTGAIQAVDDVISEQENANLTVDKDNALEATFETDSFSNFAITWKQGSETKVQVNVYYVDAQGNEIKGAHSDTVEMTVPKKNNSNSVTIDQDHYFSEISGYERNGIYRNDGNGGKVKVSDTACTLKVSRSSNNNYTLYANDVKIDSGNTVTANIYLVYNKVSTSYTVKFYKNARNNGGTTPFASDMTVSSTSEEITLPEPNGATTDGDYQFYGWSYSSNANSEPASVIYPAGTKITLNSEKFSDRTAKFYAVWSTSGGSAKFFIKLDGTIPQEPDSIGTDKYTGGVTVENALKRNQHIYNNLEAVKANLKAEPSETQIKKLCDDYDKAHPNDKLNYSADKYKVLWYVIKKEEVWHVDGVLLERAKCTLIYEPNCATYTGTVIPGKQYETNEKVTVQGSWIDNTENPKELVRTGYTFTGWNTAADGSGTNYSIGSTITMPDEKDATVTLYAQWVPQNTSYVEIQKKIAGLADGDKTGPLTFTATNTKDATDVHTATLTASGNGTYKMKLYGLTVDASYTITEGTADVTGYTCVTAIDPKTVTAPADPQNDPVSVTVTNTYTRQTGTLIIKKTVTAENAARLADVVQKLQSELTFQIQGQNGVANLADQTVTASTAYADGVYTVTIDNVPSGSYIVNETGYEVAGYTCTTEGNGGTVTVVKGANATYELSNDYTMKTGTVAIAKYLIDGAGSSVTAKDDGTYLFHLSGKTIAGENASYYIQVTVKKGLVSATTEKDGILYGTYTVEELDSVNATFVGWQDDKDTVQLSEEQNSDRVGAYNKYEYHFQTDSDVAVNQFYYNGETWRWKRETETAT